MQTDANLEMQRFAQSIADLITSGSRDNRNHWGEIASVICCARSDVYLKTLIAKIKDYFLDPDILPMLSKKRKGRQAVSVS